MNLGIVKKHPIGTATVIIVGGLLVYYFWMGGNSSSGSSSGGQMVTYGTSGGGGGDSALAQMQTQIYGQLAIAQMQGTYDLAVKEMAGRLSLAETQINANTNLAGQAAQLAYQSHVADEQYQLGMATLSTQLQSLQIQANSADLASKLAAQTTVAQAQIAAQMQTNLTAITSQTQVSLGAQQLEGYKAMTQAQVDTARIYGNASKSASKDSMWGSIAGAAIMAFTMMCDVQIKTIESRCVDSEACLNAVETLPLDFWRYVDSSLPGQSGDTRMHVGTYAQRFYKELGVDDWHNRTSIDSLDLFGVLIGSVKELKKVAA